MKGMPEILNGNLTEDELQQEITERWALVNQMVGTLYPSVLAGEVSDIQELIYKKRLA